MKFKIKSLKEATSLEIFLNKNTNLLSYKDVKNIIKTIESTNQNNSTEITEFLIFNGGDPYVFYRTGNIVGGYAEWGNTIDGSEFLIQFNNMAMEWEISVDGSVQGTATDSNPSDIPIGGDWGLGNYIYISVFNGTLQNVLEQLAEAAETPMHSSNISYSNITSNLTGIQSPLNVQEAIDELAGITTTVDMSAAQILDMHNTPIELLPALSGPQYYDIHSAIFEVSAGTAYVTPAGDSVVTGYGNLGISAFDGTDAYIIKLTPTNQNYNNTQSAIQSDAIALGVASGFYMTGADGNAWTTGNKTVRVIIRYSVRTLGA